ncbi:MAG: hypothetical protein IJ867_05845 [Clostridia bacterium]|nr:hypothetical protein [Clostridia bacterium]
MAVWGKKKDIEERITGSMQKVFSTKKDRKMAIHVAAATGAGIVAVLPIGIDAWALRVAEVVMVICVASSYGEKLTKSAAKGLFLSSFAQLVGEKVAIALLEALEAGKVASAPTGVGPAAAYAAKAGVAVGLIEAVGNMVIAYYEKPESLTGKACKTAEIIGVSADIARVFEALAGLTEVLTDKPVAESGKSEISFKGNSLSEAERRDAVRKAGNVKDKLKEAKAIAQKTGDSQQVANINKAIQKIEYLQSDITLNRSTIQSTFNDAQRAIGKVANYKV